MVKLFSPKYLTKMKKILSLTYIVIVLTSCAASHSGVLSDSASLGSANFSYVKKEISGQSTVTYIFGIGGLAKLTLVNSAKQDMLKHNELKSNQSLANISVNFKSSNYAFVFRKLTCIVTSDIVEFNK